MSEPLTNQPLNDSEFARLADFLDEIGPPAMNLEMVDGFFVALICGPELVPPSEYLQQIWGEDYAFDSDAQAIEILDLLMRHWNTIANEFARILEEDDVYLPVLMEDDQGVANGNDWAHGFMRGVRMRTASWQDLITSETHGGWLVPIMMLEYEHDPDPEMRPPPISPEKREEVLKTMIAALTGIYRYFERSRQRFATAPARRTGAKIGRNETCPCGSGRKYKRCCANEPRLH